MDEQQKQAFYQELAKLIATFTGRTVIGVSIDDWRVTAITGQSEMLGKFNSTDGLFAFSVKNTDTGLEVREDAIDVPAETAT